MEQNQNRKRGRPRITMPPDWEALLFGSSIRTLAGLADRVSADHLGPPIGLELARQAHRLVAEFIKVSEQAAGDP
jgi:hypothetical protein